MLQALSEIPVSQVAKTFSQLKGEEVVAAKQQGSSLEEPPPPFTSRELDKLTRLESHAILDEIGVLQDTHVDNQVCGIRDNRYLCSRDAGPLGSGARSVNS